MVPTDVYEAQKRVEAARAAQAAAQKSVWDASTRTELQERNLELQEATQELTDAYAALCAAQKTTQLMSSSALGLGAMTAASGLMDSVFTTGLSYGSVFTTAQAVENSAQSYAFGTSALDGLSSALDSASQSVGHQTGSGTYSSSSYPSSYPSTSSGGGTLYPSSTDPIDAYTQSVFDPISQYAATFGSPSSSKPTSMPTYQQPSRHSISTQSSQSSEKGDALLHQVCNRKLCVWNDYFCPKKGR